MKERTKAYMAGLLDAEGCFSVSKSIRPEGYVVYDPLIRLTTTHRLTGQWIVKTFGGVLKKRTWDTPGWRDYYQWRICNDKHGARFLSLIAPYLRLKRAEALILCEYYSLFGEQCPEKREELYHRAAQLKDRESVTANTLDFPWKQNLINAYMAGIFDGEGSCYIVKYTQRHGGAGFRPAVALSNTCRPLICALQKHYGGVYRQRPPHGGSLAIYEWDLRRISEQERFLLQTLPYMRIKSEVSKLLLRFVRLGREPNVEARAELYEATRTVNGKKIESSLPQ